jgi:hypothetical protein
MLSVRDWLRRRRKTSRGFARMNADQIKQYEQIRKTISEV